MPEIKDFADSEKWIIKTARKGHYRSPLPYDSVDAEMQPALSDYKLSVCPVAIWQHDSCNLAQFQSGERHDQPFGTGVYEYDDLAECMVPLLPVQDNHFATERGGS